MPNFGGTGTFFFGVLEPSWAPRWAHVGGQDEAKIDKKSIPKNDEPVKNIPKSGKI